jgi:predicted phage gp36 major capsid-like protein
MESLGDGLDRLGLVTQAQMRIPLDHFQIRPSAQLHHGDEIDAGDAPNMLLGHPISIDPNMPGMTASQKSILFGDLSTYYIRLVRAPRVLRLEERYADYLQLGFLGFLRADGDLIDGGGSVKALQQA